MSECVVRMEIRKNCLDCDLHQIVYGDSYADTDVYCFKEKRLVGKRFGPTKDLERPSWCPIICQLPEGHGRLGDLHQPCPGQVLAQQGLVSNHAVVIYAKNAPTIVPAERSEKDGR